MITYIFPGQGSQKKGMGGDLFDEFEELTEVANNILGYSVKELCIENTASRLGQTLYVQPAIYTVSAFMYYKKIMSTAAKPDFVAGHSVGEYNALLAAEAFDFATGLNLVKKRAELMSASAGGRMAAVIGLDKDEVLAVLDKNGLTSLSISHYNTPTQIVISGPKNDIILAEKKFDAAGAQLYIHLELDGAFHSKYMQNARQEFAHYLDGFTFSALHIPVIANCTGKPYSDFDIKKNVIEQFTEPVKWTDSIVYLLRQGDMEFIEIGPGSIMSGLIHKIRLDVHNNGNGIHSD